MGLSHDERMSKMFWAVHHLNDLGQKLPDKCYPTDFARLKSLCDQAWHAFIGNKGNGGHWLLGSSAGNNIGKPDNPWAVALTHHFEVDQADTSDDWRAKALEAQEKAYKDAEDQDMVDPPQDDDVNETISIASLLGKDERSTGLSEVFRIYATTENLIYALRRYDDELLGGFDSLNKLVSDIQGACFEVFAEHDIFAKAYLLHTILEDLYKWGNPVRGLALKQTWHYDLTRPMKLATIKDLRGLHLSISNPKNPPSATDWVELALTLMGRGYYDKHALKELFRIAKKRKLDVDEARVQAAFDLCVKAKQDNDKSCTNTRKQDSDYAHLTAIHGHDVGYKLIHGEACGNV